MIIKFTTKIIKILIFLKIKLLNKYVTNFENNQNKSILLIDLITLFFKYCNCAILILQFLLCQLSFQVCQFLQQGFYVLCYLVSN